MPAPGARCGPDRRRSGRTPTAGRGAGVSRSRARNTGGRVPGSPLYQHSVINVNSASTRASTARVSSRCAVPTSPSWLIRRRADAAAACSDSLAVGSARRAPASSREASASSPSASAPMQAAAARRRPSSAGAGLSPAARVSAVTAPSASPRPSHRWAACSSSPATVSSGLVVASPRCPARRSGWFPRTAASARCALRRSAAVARSTTAEPIRGCRKDSRPAPAEIVTSRRVPRAPRGPRPPAAFAASARVVAGRVPVRASQDTAGRPPGRPVGTGSRTLVPELGPCGPCATPAVSRRPASGHRSAVQTVMVLYSV